MHLHVGSQPTFPFCCGRINHAPNTRLTTTGACRKLCIVRTKQLFWDAVLWESLLCLAVDDYVAVKYIFLLQPHQCPCREPYFIGRGIRQTFRSRLSFVSLESPDHVRYTEGAAEIQSHLVEYSRHDTCNSAGHLTDLRVTSFLLTGKESRLVLSRARRVHLMASHHRLLSFRVIIFLSRFISGPPFTSGSRQARSIPGGTPQSQAAADFLSACHFSLFRSLYS